MILGGLALAFSRVIDNSVISIENIYRHLEMGEVPMLAAQVGAPEVTLAVLAATLVAVVDFFPGHLALRREQVSVFRAGAVILHFAARFVHRRDDRDSAVLLAIPEGGSAWARRHGRDETPGGRPRETLAGGALQCGFNHGFNRHARYLRKLGAARSDRPS